MPKYHADDTAVPSADDKPKHHPRKPEMDDTRKDGTEDNPKEVTQKDNTEEKADDKPYMGPLTRGPNVHEPDVAGGEASTLIYPIDDNTGAHPRTPNSYTSKVST